MQGKENSMVEIMWTYDKGLHPYHGLIKLGLDVGYLSRNGLKVVFPNGEEAKESKINNNPEKYWTDEVLQAMDIDVKKHFLYGSKKD